MMGLYLFIALGGMLDNFASYRSLLAVCSVVLALPLLFYPLRPLRASSGKFFVLVGMGVGLLTLASPQTRPDLQQEWRQENLDFSWHGPVYRLILEPNQCRQIDLKIPFPRGTSQILVAAFSPKELPERFANFSVYRDFFKSRAYQELGVENDRWHQLCFCHQPSRGEGRQDIGIFVEKAEYLSLSQHNYGHDDRFIGFALKQAQVTTCGNLPQQPFPQ
jgi:hypothetical protein